MEHPGATVPGVAGELADVARRSGPFLSVYLTTERSVELAAQRAEARWRPLRRQLREQGAPEEELDAVERLVPDAHLEGAALGVVQAAGPAGSPAFVDHDGEPLPSDLVAWGPAPVLTPSITWRQGEPAYVTVLADRQGADLLAVTRDRPAEDESVGNAADWPLTKVRGGGWAQWRYQRRVEENWARNQRLVASEIERVVDRVRAQAVLVAGDDEAIGVLRPMLAERVQDLVHTVPGSRAAEGAGEDLREAARRWVRSAAATVTVAALEALRSRLAHGLAVEGAEGTLAALREARVDVLLVHDGRLTALPREDRTAGGAPAHRQAWFAVDAPQECASDRWDLEGLGLGEMAQAPLVDVAVRAALVTGGSVLMVPSHGGPAEGIGALLRWSEGGE